MTDFEPHPTVDLGKPATAVAPGPFTTAALPPVPQHPAAPVAAAGPHAGYGFPPAAVPYPTTVVVQQSNVEIIVAWVFTALTLLYMLPWAVAATRRSTNSVLIAIATFFLAWTGIGWLVLLVLSFLGPTVYSARTVVTYAPVPTPVPAGMWAHCATDPPHVRRWWDGYSWTPHTTV